MLREISRVIDQFRGALHSTEKDQKPLLRWSDKIDKNVIFEMRGHLISANRAEYIIAPYPLLFDSSLGGKNMTHIVSILDGASSLNDQGKLIFVGFQIRGEDGHIVVARKPNMSEEEALYLLVKTVDLAEHNLEKANFPIIPPPHKNIFISKQ